MKTKTRCILSILLILLPIFLIGVAYAGDFLLQINPDAAWLLLGISNPLGEAGWLLYVVQPLLCAFVAVGMHVFAQNDLPTRLEKLLLALPLAAGICSILNFLCMWLVGGMLFVVLTALSAAALLGWFVCNIAALVYLRREKRKDNT